MSNNDKTVPRGWYKSSSASEIERYWNGTSWTEEVRVASLHSEVFPNHLVTENQHKNTFITLDRLLFIAVISSLTVIGLVLGFNKAPDEKVPSPMKISTATPQATEPQFIETVGLESVESCKIKDQRTNPQQPNNVGFPLEEDLIPAQGNANLIAVAVDFPDARGQQPETEYLLEQTQRITEWGKYYSQGKLNYSFQVHEGWVTVPRNSAEYVVPWTNPHTQNETIEIQDQLTEDVIRSLGNEYDFSNIHGILILFPPTVEGIEKDLGGRGGTLLQTPQGPKELFYWGGGKYHFTDAPGYIDAAGKRDQLWSFWIHEMLHSQGISLHAPGNGFLTGLQSNQYGGSFALDAWELFLLGWTDDNQIHCLDRELLTSSQIKLNSSDVTTAGTRAAIIRLSDHEALVIESRRPVGYSSSWPENVSGIFVYKVDTTLDNDRSHECCGDMGNDPTYPKWAFYLLPDGRTVMANSPLTQHNDYIVRQGDSVTYEDLSIELVYSGKQDFVKITKQ
ncbi:DUF2510 domain-containing protein [Aurantimicrobium minutum]|uniref:DUF2510 domain-containing protein n=1 Tax=Aurantimicrobium minutum TaxID=708131 RepID=UPI00247376C2|nr:DUF2510 domain-containing protein [Aurantimicrobium minutum]MDH6239545.1 hypothetical protein [Aurantimicrobium minutum]